MEPVDAFKGETAVQVRRIDQAKALNDKAGELTCLFIAFGFALQ